MDVYFTVKSVDAKLVILKKYRALGEKLLPLINVKERGEKAREAVSDYLDLIIQEIDLLEKTRALLLKYPDHELVNTPYTTTPEQHRELQKAEVKLYNKYIELGMSEAEALEFVLDPRSMMFRRFDDEATINGISGVMNGEDGVI